MVSLNPSAYAVVFAYATQQVAHKVPGNSLQLALFWIIIIGGAAV
jgi:hypothetical protein